jgi:hypothetical protein
VWSSIHDDGKYFAVIILGWRHTVLLSITVMHVLFWHLAVLMIQHVVCGIQHVAKILQHKYTETEERCKGEGEGATLTCHGGHDDRRLLWNLLIT